MHARMVALTRQLLFVTAHAREQVNHSRNNLPIEQIMYFGVVHMRSYI